MQNQYGPNLIDVDGNIYPSIISPCSDQIWTARNLSVSKYRNGDEIPQVTDSKEWASLTKGAWCWYNNDAFNYWQYESCIIGMPLAI